MNATQYPNANVFEDLASLRFAVFALVIGSVVHLSVGIYLLGQGVPGVAAKTAVRFGWFSLVEALLLFAMAVGAYRMRSEAIVAGMVISVVGIVTSLITKQWLIILMNIGLTALIFRGYRSLVEMNQRIQNVDQDNPMTQFYHRMIPILVKVMGADGHVDRRERQQISSLCNAMNISKYERNFLINRASKQAGAPKVQTAMGPLVVGYLQAAREIQQSNPHQALMVAALAVVESDGIVVKEELDILHEIGDHLGWSDDQIKLFIMQHQTHHEDLDEAKALQLLGLSEGATEQDIKQSYHTFLTELKSDQFKHIGTQLESHVTRRKEALQKAYELLTA